ncbi:vacuole membrane protein KMS1-like isoform X1 [Salvia splendens]|uniref:vacuole membrane protein KMS1-like isoform X1 n=2 Tax=Salvia splendens TaxID=180675 RepID=UPI001100D8D7|nr:vacuole membrane protein KMS1-like isoform X1 [Salvia splendens]
MGSNKILNSDSISGDRAMSISGLREKHQQDLENLTLTSQPFKTLKLFVLAVRQYIRKSVVYMLSHAGWLILLSVIVAAIGTLLVTVEGPHGKHVEEIQRYVQFVLWWVALGVASSIGLGSGLHTFVLYLGPHIAFFTIKAIKCGRVDIKSASYDTIQLKKGPSWLRKNCADFGPPLFPSSDGVRIPLSSILPQVQLEAILWGLGTALGELPPYFISRAARLSGNTVDAMEELDASSAEDEGILSTRLNQIKRWFLSQAQYLNFFTILILASVPNPLFDLAGIMCGQFGIPFWEFFLATVIGKAIIKTHIQTVFIISVCNNQLLHWMENELLWLSSFVPGFSNIMPKLIANLHSMKDKYLSTKPEPPASVKAANWDFSLTTIWNTVVWIMLMNFFVKIVNSTAQGHLMKEQDQEIAALKNKSSEPSNN